jgi:hypothetical protein
MRVSHLYTGLFLVPWMTVYAISAFCLNHNELFPERFRMPNKSEAVSDVEFAPPADFPQAAQERAKALLKVVDLEGPHRILGDPDANPMVIYRPSGAGNYRVTWNSASRRVVVEQYRPVSFFSLMHFLHFLHGYDQPYFATWTWGIVVDRVTISTILWVLTGIWIWARRPRKRLLGGLCLAAGTLLFLGLTAVLCR